MSQVQLLEEERKKAINEVLQKLQFAINPKIYELRVLPYSFVEIPSVSRFGTARYKFKKYLGKGFVLFHDDEFLSFIIPALKSETFIFSKSFFPFSF